MRKDYGIVGSYDNQRITSFNSERTVNMFEYIDPNGKRPNVLFSTSGIENTNLIFSPETGGSRATFVYKNAIYQVFGESVFRITGSTGELSFSLIGTLNTDVGYIGIDANTFQVIFVDGEDGWIWDINASSFKEISDTGFPEKPLDVCYLDGFFIVANGDTNNFQLSSFEQGMVWSENSATFTADDAIDILTLSTTNANFSTGVPVTLSTTGSLPSPLNNTETYYVISLAAPPNFPGLIQLATTYENAIAAVPIDILTNGTPTNTITVFGQLQQGAMTSHPGTIVACRTLHRRLFLFSQNFIEVWENAGSGTNLPLRRNNALLMEVGTPAIGSISVGFDRMFFLSQDRDGLGSVMEVNGTQAVPVSNRALDYQLAQYASDKNIGVADARGILIKENGIIFYRLNFTLADHTFVLNVTMSTPDNPKWHEEEVLNGERHPAETHAFFDGVNYVGLYNSSIFSILDDSIDTNNGESIRRMRIGRQMTPEGYNRLRIDRFQLDVLQGDVERETPTDSFMETESGAEILTEGSDPILIEQQREAVPFGRPYIFLSISKDGGQSYGYLLKEPMGQIGERTFRTVWRKLGTIPRGQGFTPRIEFYNEVPFVVLGAAWDFEVLPE